jgi:hypothetical protein
MNRLIKANNIIIEATFSIQSRLVINDAIILATIAEKNGIPTKKYLGKGA